MSGKEPKKSLKVEPPLRRRYTKEFKEQAVQMLLDGHSAKSVAENLGIEKVNSLYRWKCELLQRSGPAAATMEARLREQQELIERLERERDILKKALAIFSRPG